MFSTADLNSRRVTLRRALFLSLMGVLIVTGSLLMAAVLFVDGVTVLNSALFLLFLLLFTQVSFGFVQAVTGFYLLLRGGDPWRINRSVTPGWVPAKIPPTAIVLPVSNEDVRRVFAGLRSMYESLQNTGHLEAFDFFVLSDSSDPNHWIEEEKAWLELCKEVNGYGRIFYRKRRVRLNHKSGNIADFCRRWGSAYRYMIGLDADSIMSGAALVRLTALMERNPRAGIIQTASRLVRAETLFGRIQQFANRLYSPLFVAGANFWHLGGGNYWGHNAIIRLKPFMEFCALPELPSASKTRRHFLSHDTIEAALMRKAGYGVWFAYDLEGSYEEGPPNLLASLRRDQRWCRGNLQHLRFVFTRGLKLSSRLHILTGVFSYVSAPLWLAFLLLGTILAVKWHTTEPIPASVQIVLSSKATLLFGYVMLLLLLPKFLAWLNLLRDRAMRQGFGGMINAFRGVLGETFFSLLLAPILMFSYTRIVLALCGGATVKWTSQSRSADQRPGWKDLLRVHLSQVLFAGGWFALVAWLAPGSLPGLTLVLLGLIVALPFAHWTGSAELGRWARRRGWFLIPEEVAPPPELARLETVHSDPPTPLFHDPEYAAEFGLLQAVLDPYFNAIHTSLLRRLQPTSERRQRFLERLSGKLLHAGPQGLRPEEKAILLWDADTMIRLHKQLWTSPADQLHPWWQRALSQYNITLALAVRRQAHAA